MLHSVRNLKMINEIMQVKNSSPFTCNLTFSEYIEGVKHRLSIYTGISKDKITLEIIHKYLTNKCINY